MILKKLEAIVKRKGKAKAKGIEVIELTKKLRRYIIVNLLFNIILNFIS
jgi:hypothetical protein